MSRPGDPNLLQPQSWREQQNFQRQAQALVRLPGPAAPPLAHLLSEAEWQARFPADQDLELELMALSQATGVYFFPSKEWVMLIARWLQNLRISRVLEAGAGRGYLAAALGPLLAQANIAFRAIDRREGEFNPGLGSHPSVEAGDVFAEIWNFRPQVVIYAWPPPGQSLAAICRCPHVRYLVVIGERNGGCTGAAADWQRFRHQVSGILSRYGIGRSGRRHHAVTVFYGAGSPKFAEYPSLG
ncbi:MAG: hypothetical protein DRG58_09235 [Deltaproteobacteria bacterium]|nr:MAG: hypothetical protein DRG58_09235 [Deltaproteobacteria bacterium]